MSEFEMPEQELTRRAMYDLVWSRPMTKVAEDLGISDVGLKTICDKHRGRTPPNAGVGQSGTRAIHSTSRCATRAHRDYGSRNNLVPEICEFWSKSKNAERAS